MTQPRDVVEALLIDAMLDRSDVPPDLSEIRMEGFTEEPDWVPEFVDAGGLLLVERSWRNPGANPYSVTDSRWGFSDDEGAEWFLNEHAINVFSDTRLTALAAPEGAYVFTGSAGYGQGERVSAMARAGRIVISVGAMGSFDATTAREIAVRLLDAALQRTQEALDAPGSQALRDVGSAVALT